MAALPSRTTLFRSVQKSPASQLDYTNGRLGRQERRFRFGTLFPKVPKNPSDHPEVQSFDPILHRIKMAYALLPYRHLLGLEFCLA